MDKVGLAISAPMAQPPAQRWKGRVALRASGREIGLDIPADLTPVEMVDVIAFIADQLPGVLRKARAESPASRLLIPQ